MIQVEVDKVGGRRGRRSVQSIRVGHQLAPPEASHRHFIVLGRWHLDRCFAATRRTTTANDPIAGSLFKRRRAHRRSIRVNGWRRSEGATSWVGSSTNTTGSPRDGQRKTYFPRQSRPTPCGGRANGPVGYFVPPPMAAYRVSSGSPPGAGTEADTHDVTRIPSPCSPAHPEASPNPREVGPRGRAP